MSTKIYHGFKVGTNDLSVVVSLVRTFRKDVWGPRALEVYKNFTGKVIAGFSVQDDQSQFNAWKVWNEMRREIVRTGERHPAVDTDFSITLFPYEDHLLGIAYTEHDEWFTTFLKLPGIREYGYWNNTDPDERVSEAEWEQRRRAWDYVLGETGTPAKEGFSIDIHDAYIPGEW